LGIWNALPNGFTFDSPAAAVCGGRLHFVVRGTDGGTIWRSSVSLSDGAFSGWTPFSYGSTPSAPTLASDGVVMCLVVRGLDNRIYYCMYDPIFDVWGSSWTALPSGFTCDSPAATILNGNLHIVVRSTDGLNIWHSYVELGTGVFSGWTLVGGFTESAPTLATCTSRSEVILVVRGLDNAIYRNSWSPSGWAGWSALPSGLTGEGVGAHVVGEELYGVVGGIEGSSIWESNVNLSTGTFSGWTQLDGFTPSKPTLLG
jgi:hypothetical protein